ncbi:MAG TPA: dihydrolipoyl dehydrogenase [Wenzhouxiangella sp.]|nr:dihydrolipoyl dehydrogenase [Wenzhouxiangella sp.]
MSNRKEIVVPDIGDFDKVPVIEVLVAQGDKVEKEDSLLTLESDKATMDLPSPASGQLVELTVSEGDEVGQGDVIGIIEVSGQAGGNGDSAPAGAAAEKPRESASPEKSQADEGRSGQDTSPVSAPDADHDHDFDLLVLGAGPAGYSAAFRASDLGMKVALVERHETLGGVCLNVGCIPSKALLHVAGVINSASALSDAGIDFGALEIDIDKLRKHKNQVVDRLTAGLAGMAKKRGVEVIHGRGQFSGRNEMTIEHAGKSRHVSFNQCIVAAGSRTVNIPGLPENDSRIMDSTGALELEDIPERLLVIGGGIIGLEMACVYSTLGSEVTVVEMMDRLIPGADADLVRPLQQHLKKSGIRIYTGTKVVEVEAGRDDLAAQLEGGDAPERARFDRVLVSVGRRPNGDRINAQAAGIEVDDKGFVKVDGQMRTNHAHIFAIGDIVGQPMLAHKGSYEGKVAAEVAAGHRRAADARVIPSVAYTDPEVAWVGVTEEQCRADGIEYELGKFPWAASGRALGLGRSEGFTKLIFDRKSDRLIGAGIVGVNAGDLISELALAIEMGSVAADLALTIHPHPTLSESVMMAAEVHEGTITDLYLPKS